ncbi:MAG TPA: CoA-binding protein [Chitinophagaceae bacterium]|jgi:predicted CoA-binding protein|nr:CoA-binding protein [Chitinophagaceae bacterium]
MTYDTKLDLKKILNAAKTILLIDWPDSSLPRTLRSAGFSVFCYSPNHYSEVDVVSDYPHDVNQKNIFPPRNKDEGYLVFRPVENSPGSVDIVNIYRPEKEHAEIITKHVLPLGAKVLWLHPPLTSATTRSLAKEHGLIFIEAYNIAEAVMH